jgi:tetratricopeptide (TPR) repeat protein
VELAAKKRFILLFSLVLTLALFGPSLYFKFFIFDDGELIFNNLKVVNATWKEVFNYWSLSNTPIIFNVWQFVSMIFGTDEAMPFRMLNVTLHGFNGFLVYLWCREILPASLKDEKLEQGTVEKAALFGLICYLVHPVHVEAVVWVSSLKEVLSATFGLISFIFYLKNGRAPRTQLEILTAVFYLLGILTHPTVAALPLVYIWLDFVIYRKNVKEVFYKNGIFFLLLMAAVIIHKTVNPQVVEDNEQLYVKILVALSALFGHLEKSFFPFNYSFDYMVVPADVAALTKSLLWPKIKAFLGVIFIWSLFESYRNKRYLTYHYSLTLIVLLSSVNLGFIGYSFQNISTIADRFLYFPSIGVSLLISFIYVLFLKIKNAQWRLLIKSVGNLVILTFFLLSVHRLYLWRSSSSLLESGIQSGYTSYPLYLSIGVALTKEKEYPGALQNLEEAYNLATRVDKFGKKILSIDGSEALGHLFRVYRELGDKEKGIVLAQKVVANNESITPALAMSMAEYFISLNRWYEADKFINLGMIINPESTTLKNLKSQIDLIKANALVDSYVNLGISAMNDKNYIVARDNFERAIESQKKLKINREDLYQFLQLTGRLSKK